ncbi:MAG: hypothetical protein FWD98_08500 [Defluviitaleaceae bacterium]|nr:hypothetical protein [Defluviitaleaceae bacterium]
MNDKDKHKTLEEFVNPEERAKISNWPAFVEAHVVNFFNEHQLEKFSLEDGNGNKAKLSRQKDDGIKVEYSSTTIL